MKVLDRLKGIRTDPSLIVTLGLVLVVVLLGVTLGSKKPAVLISTFALIFSWFTFYWTVLRQKRSFHLVWIDQQGPGSPRPQFALLNGGDKDLLLTRVRCGFELASGGGACYPMQAVSLGDTDAFLLPAGKAVHCKVSFLDPFTADFVLAGTKEDYGHWTVYNRDLKVEVEWIELNGLQHRKFAKVYRYGFETTGQVRKGSLIKKEHDLYR